MEGKWKQKQDFVLPVVVIFTWKSIENAFYANVRYFLKEKSKPCHCLLELRLLSKRTWLFVFLLAEKALMDIKKISCICFHLLEFNYYILIKYTKTKNPFLTDYSSQTFFQLSRENVSCLKFWLLFLHVKKSINLPILFR